MNHHIDKKQYHRLSRWLYATYALWGLLLIILAKCNVIFRFRDLVLITMAVVFITTLIWLVYRRKLKSLGEKIDDRLSKPATIAFLMTLASVGFLPDSSQVSATFFQMEAGAFIIVSAGTVLLDSLFKRAGSERS